MLQAASKPLIESRFLASRGFEQVSGSEAPEARDFVFAISGLPLKHDPLAASEE